MAKEKSNNDLPQITPEYRPKVLLVGNGINLSFEGSKGTKKIIQEEWKKNYGTDLPGSNHPIWDLPFPMQVVVASKDHVQECMDQIASVFKETEIENRQMKFINKILDGGFDSILTTNYSMEFERTVISGYSPAKVYRMYVNTKEMTAAEEKFGMYRCTKLPCGNDPTLWHIHGTALNKKSLVMGQLYYGNLLAEVQKRAREVKRAYHSELEKGKSFTPQSWVDYFLLGDVHMMGFQLDVSETDIWWLLSYKKSAFPDRSTLIYQPQVKDSVQLMLDCYGVKVPSIPFEENGKDRYLGYYRSVLESI